MKRERFILDPKESARENLWRAAINAAGVILSRKKLNLTDEEWKELRMNLVVRGVRHFMEHKIGMHEYNRAFPFYNNVYSSIWSSSHNVLDAFLKENRAKISARSADKAMRQGGETTFMEMFEDTGVHPLDYVKPSDDPGWRERTEKSLERAREMARHYHNKGFYVATVRRLEESLKRDTEMARAELLAETGLQEDEK